MDINNTEAELAAIYKEGQSNMGMQEIDYVFNVENPNSFRLVGGTTSTESFFIYNNDTFLYENTSENIPNDEFLSDVYIEDTFTGDEDTIFIPQVTLDYPTVDVELLNSAKGYDPENPDSNLSTDASSKYQPSKDIDSNIKIIIKTAKSLGVTNKYAISAILSIIKKESGFVPRCESSYASTSTQRIKEIFGLSKYSDSSIDDIKKNDVSFFNLVYGGKYENNSDEGYRYRGRGFNQLTFKSAYRRYSKNIGVNLVNDPDLLNTIEVASKCVIYYFKDTIKKAPADKKSYYGFTDINSFVNLDSATGAIYHANAGFGKSISKVLSDSTGGRKKAFASVGSIYNKYEGEMV